MKKYIFIFLIIFTVLISSIVIYYKFDPELLTRISFYVNLANPYVRIVKVQEGLRKEEVAEVVGDRLGWGDAEKQDFINSQGSDVEGHYFPKTYLIYKDADPVEVRATMMDEFDKQLIKVSKPKNKKIISEETALKIASIIQREAARCQG